MDTALVTGATGFIGGHLVKALKKKKVRVKIFDRKRHSLSDVNSLLDLVDSCDTAFHLAAINNPDSPDLFKVNVLGTANLLEAISKFSRGCRIVYPSTIGICRIPNKGEVVNETCEVHPRNKYVLSKFLSEELIRYYSDVEDVTAVILRISNVYGPEDKVGRSITANFIEGIKNGKEITLYGNGSQTRDFVYVDDLVEAMIKAGLSRLKDNLVTVNICSGEETSLKTLISLIEELSGKKALVVRKNPNVSGGGFWRGDNRLASQLLGWRPKVALREGLRKTLEQV